VGEEFGGSVKVGGGGPVPVPEGFPRLAWCFIINLTYNQGPSYGWASLTPFEKGGFRGISDSYKITPKPLLEKGGIKLAANQA
jgi:hypothetical protein